MQKEQIWDHLIPGSHLSATLHLPVKHEASVSSDEDFTRAPSDVQPLIPYWLSLVVSLVPSASLWEKHKYLHWSLFLYSQYWLIIVYIYGHTE